MLINILQEANKIKATSISLPTLAWHQDPGFPEEDQAYILIKYCINWLILNLFEEKDCKVKDIRLCSY